MPLEVDVRSLTVLRRLLYVVTQAHLRQFLCDVFNHKELRDRVLMDVPGRVSGLVLRMEAAAHRVYQQTGLAIRTTEALYCATLVARLPEILEMRGLDRSAVAKSSGTCDNPFDAHMDRAIARLRQSDSCCAWLMRWVVAGPNQAKSLEDFQEEHRSEQQRYGKAVDVAAEIATAVTFVQLIWIQTLAMDPELEGPPFISPPS